MPGPALLEGKGSWTPGRAAAGAPGPPARGCCGATALLGACGCSPTPHRDRGDSRLAQPPQRVVTARQKLIKNKKILPNLLVPQRPPCTAGQPVGPCSLTHTRGFYQGMDGSKQDPDKGSQDGIPPTEELGGSAAAPLSFLRKGVWVLGMVLCSPKPAANLGNKEQKLGSEAA